SVKTPERMGRTRGPRPTSEGIRRTVLGPRPTVARSPPSTAEPAEVVRVGTAQTRLWHTVTEGLWHRRPQAAAPTEQQAMPTGPVPATNHRDLVRGQVTPITVPKETIPPGTGNSPPKNESTSGTSTSGGPTTTRLGGMNTTTLSTDAGTPQGSLTVSNCPSWPG